MKTNTKLPPWAKMMLIKPMISMAVEAYKQGKSDFEDDEYDEDEFKKMFTKKLKKSL